MGTVFVTVGLGVHVSGWLEEWRERRRRRSWLVRGIGVPLFAVLLVVSLVSAKASFIDARRDGQFMLWLTFILYVGAALLSASWLWVLCDQKLT